MRLGQHSTANIVCALSAACMHNVSHEVYGSPTEHRREATRGNAKLKTMGAQVQPSKEWLPCLYSRSVVEKLLRSQLVAFLQKWRDIVEHKEDCGSTARSLAAAGAPHWCDFHEICLCEQWCQRNKLRLLYRSFLSEDCGDMHPLRLADAEGLPLPPQQRHVDRIWFMHNANTVSARLRGDS